MTLLCFQIYEKEPKLCVVTHLSEYLKRIKSYRDTDKLLLTYIKSYRAISKDTISRWCKSIVKESGISIHSYTSRSSRAQLHHMRRPEEHRYPQSFEVQVGNQRGICPVLRKSNRRRSRVSKLFTTGKLNFTKNL